MEQPKEMRAPRARRGRLFLTALLVVGAGDGEFDWKRDLVVLKGGKEERGVVIEDCDPKQVVLLLDGGKRKEFPRAEVERVDKLRDRLASFLEKCTPELPLELEWQLVEDAQSARLPHMARMQAYRVLLRDPKHAKAHEFLGHRDSGEDWDWVIDKKPVSEKKFQSLSRDWNHRLVLESEHFVVETDAGLGRGLEVVFDLEGLYVWWMENLGPVFGATEDVDDPRSEKMTLFLHKDRESFQPLDDPYPYYDPSGRATTTKGGINVARTFYRDDATTPEELFELGAQSLIYSTLVLGKTKGREPTLACKRSAHWVEIGLAYWVARHCGGPPGYPEFLPMAMDGTFELDFDTARLTLAPVSGGPLPMARNELTNLIGLHHENFVGTDPNIPLYMARCASFVSYLIEVNPPVFKGRKQLGSGREGLWYYFREVYGTPTASSSSAFDEGFGGAKVETLEKGWKAWTKPFSSTLRSKPEPK